MECAMTPIPRGRPRGDDAGDRSKGDADIVGASSARRCTCRTIASHEDELQRMTLQIYPTILMEPPLDA